MCVPMGIIILFPFLIYNGSISIQKSLPMGGFFYRIGFAAISFAIIISHNRIAIAILGRLIQDDGDEARAPPG